MLTVDGARARQKRLLAVMQRLKVDAVAIGNPKHVYYFTAFWPFWLHSAAFLLFADGTTTLIAAENKLDVPYAADNVIPFAANRAGTQRPDQPEEVATQMVTALQERRVRHIAVDASVSSSELCLRCNLQVTSIQQELQQLRRIKDPDELQLIVKANECCRAMYQRATEIIEPGVAELEVFAEMHRAAVLCAGEPLSDPLGNDYACGAGGGAPRQNRLAVAGELYILDLGPSYRGYFADACRAFSVDRRPNDAQQDAWQIVKGALQLAEQSAKPGARGAELYASVNAYLQEHTGSGLRHHLGHGVGLEPHEHPFLNPHWDDVLTEGEVLTLEPGVYSDQLRRGIRLENSYLVTHTGVQSLLDFPLDLV